MRLTSIKSIAGWTLIELLLVLICISSLTAVFVYAFVGRIQRQDNSVMVVANVEDLVAAAHNWRLNQPHAIFNPSQPNQKLTTVPAYQGMKNLGLLHDTGYIAPNWIESGTGWLRNGLSTYSIGPFTNKPANPKPKFQYCKSPYSCFQITISDIPHPCYVVNALADTHPKFISPSQPDCISNFDMTRSDIEVIYD